MRGGLLRKDPFSEEVCFRFSRAILLVIRISMSSKGLREMGFIEKEDIKEYNLVWLSCNESRRFNYFAD